MKVLSLFDGMSCTQIALKNLGIKVDTYYASEIDKYGIQVTQANFPDTVQVGDITKLNPNDYKDVTLIVAGSPCQVIVTGKLACGTCMPYLSISLA